MQASSPPLNHTTEVSSEVLFKHRRLRDHGMAQLEYTILGARIFTLRFGEGAPPGTPLHLFQTRRFVDEEMAVWGEPTLDLGAEFNFEQALKHEETLLEQLILAPRGVISMDWSRAGSAGHDYSHRLITKWQDDEELDTFLLVRDGENIHFVYCRDPSHEAGVGLFPSQNEAKQPFDGLDAASLTLDQLGFTSDSFLPGNDSLHFARLLVLMQGLQDERRIFGDLSPRGSEKNMLDHEFQREHFKFVAEACPDQASARPSTPVDAWFEECNRYMRIGSRVLMTESMQHTEGAKFYKDRVFVPYKGFGYRRPYIVRGADGYHHIDMILEGNNRSCAWPVWLNGPHAQHRPATAYLCLERVGLEELSRHLRCRAGRTQRVDVLMLMRDAEKILLQDRKNELGLREWLRQSDHWKRHDITEAEDVEQAIDTAIASWRAEHAGKEARNNETHAYDIERHLNKLHGREQLDARMHQLVMSEVDPLLAKPLLLTRTEAGDYALYTEPTDLDKQTLCAPGEAPTGLHWGWVMRYPFNGRLGKPTAVWLLKFHPLCTEHTVAQWPGMGRYLNAAPQPVTFTELRFFHRAMQASQVWTDTVLSAEHPGLGVAPECMADILTAIARAKVKSGATGFTTESLYVLLPIGVKGSANAKAPFVYACATVDAVMRRVANLEQRMAYALAMKSMDVHVDISQPDSSEIDWVVGACAHPLDVRVRRYPKPMRLLSGPLDAHLKKFMSNSEDHEAARSEERVSSNS